MVGYAGSPKYTAYVDMTLTPSKVNVKVTGAFELPTTSEAVHAGSDDRSPLCGAFWLYIFFYRDGAGNTVEENCSVFSLIRMH